MCVYMYHTYHVLKICKAEVLLMNMLNVRGYVLYCGQCLFAAIYFVDSRFITRNIE